MPSRIRNVPSPVEVPEPVPGLIQEARAQARTPSPMRMRHRVIPAVAGGVFAGLLLVGLGCTPLFKGSQAMRNERPTIVGAPTASNLATADTSGIGVTRAAVGQAHGESPRTASSDQNMLSLKHDTGGRSVSTFGSQADSGTHGFSTRCEPAHEGDDTNAPRPETVTLHGIMAGRHQRAALLDGVMYREGDRFGSTLCPWTIAMIDPSSVRIEKAFGDRTCGVTIHWQNADASAR